MSSIKSSSTTTNSGYLWETGPNAVLIKGSEEFESIIVPVDVGANTTVRIGFLDNTTSADAVDGIYFEYSGSGAVILKTSSNSTRTSSSTIATVSAATVYKFKIVVNSNATSVTGFIYDSSNSLLGSQAITTNIPTGASRFCGHGIIATNSGTSAIGLLQIDYMQVKKTLSR